jgi:hypothetical protein
VVSDLNGNTDLRFDGRVHGLILAANQGIADRLRTLVAVQAA